MTHEELKAERAALDAAWYADGTYSAVTVPEEFDRRLERTGSTELIFADIAGERRITLREISLESQRLAAAMYALGIRRNDIVAVQTPTSCETVLIYHAVWRLGAVLLPIVHLYGAAEVEFIVRQCNAKALFTMSRWRNIDYVARLRSMKMPPSLQHVVIAGSPVPGMVSLQDLLCDESSSYPSGPVKSDDVCLLLYTSGTTSEPKGVQHTHNTLLSRWRAWGYPRRGTQLCCFPAGHIAGVNFLMRPWLHGVSTVFIDHWQPQLVAQLVQTHRIEQSGGTPYFLISMLNAARDGGYDLSSMKSYMMGGAGVTPEHVALAENAGFTAGRSYGLTEHFTVSEPTDSMSLEERATTDGKLMPHCEVLVVDDFGNSVPCGAVGEIATRGPGLFIGYTNSNFNRDSFLPGGWFKTGDLGRLDPQGNLTIMDRKKDIIIRAGENISSKDVEDTLTRHPSIDEAAVTSMPDADYGEKVCAFVILKPGATLTLHDLAEHFVSLGVAKVKTPEGLVIVEDFPRTASGKVKKMELRRALASGTYSPLLRKWV